MERLVFGQQESIDATVEWEQLRLRLKRYKKLKKRSKSWRGNPVAPQPCCSCENLIRAKEKYFAADGDSAHEECAIKMRERKKQLDPAMGVL